MLVPTGSVGGARYIVMEVSVSNSVKIASGVMISMT